MVKEGESAREIRRIVVESLEVCGMDKEEKKKKKMKKRNKLLTTMEQDSLMSLLFL